MIKVIRTSYPYVRYNWDDLPDGLSGMCTETLTELIPPAVQSLGVAIRLKVAHMYPIYHPFVDGEASHSDMLLKLMQSVVLASLDPQLPIRGIE